MGEADGKEEGGKYREEKGREVGQRGARGMPVGIAVDVTVNQRQLCGPTSESPTPHPPRSAVRCYALRAMRETEAQCEAEAAMREAEENRAISERAPHPREANRATRQKH